MSMPSKAGVIIMTYGSATTAEHVGSYMEHIYKSGVPEGLVEDFAERYRLVGRSPLVDITREQASKLEQKLGPDRFVVRAGMLHSDPFISDVIADLRKAGAERIIGIILSPQFSSFIMDGYLTALRAAAADHGYSAEEVSVAGPWPTEPDFIELLAKRTADAQAKLRVQYEVSVPVIFTTHSLPERVVAKDPNYLTQLSKTIDAVVAKLNDSTLEWYAAYQSAGHTPEPWLKPDLVDILAELRDKKSPAVLIVPIQFLADHLEILYDLDIAGKEQCDDFGIAYNRIELPNTDPLFISALASVVQELIET
jgi:ferrochelatase